MSAPDPPLTPIEATPDSLARILAERPILWVGAGASIAAGYPSTGHLVEAMIQAADDPIDPNLSFFQIADEFIRSAGKGTLSRILQSQLGPPRDPAPLHHALARLAKAGCFSAILTTNYDNLIERALDKARVPYTLQALDSNDLVRVDGHIPLLKLHGSREDWMNVILSGKSYQQFRTRYPFLNSQLDVLLRRNSVLFVGCSLQDPRILDWLADLPEDVADGLHRWRALMTAPEWAAAPEAKWDRGHASEALSQGNVRPLILKNHAHLGELLAEVAEKLAPAEDAAQRLDVEIEVQPEGPWTARLKGCPDWHPSNLLADREWRPWIDKLRNLGVSPLPTDERGDLVREVIVAQVTLLSTAAEAGQRLTETLLSPEAREQLAAAIRAGRGGPPPFLVIRVRPLASNPECEHLADRVLALPWELLWIEDGFPVEEGTLDVAREAVVPEMRKVEEPDQPLTVVATIAAPVDVTDFDYEEEMFRLWQAIGEKGAEKRLLVTDLGTLDELARTVEQHKPPVVHISAHGRPGVLLFEDESALSDAVEVGELVRRFQDFGYLPRLIYLSACHGATAGGAPIQETAGDRMVEPAATSNTAPSTAAELHRAGFPQVVGYFGPVGDRQATRAAAVFYADLAAGKTAREALRHVRRESSQPVRDGGRATHRYPLGWAQLALYHRGSDHPTAQASSKGGEIQLPEESKRRQFDPMSKTGETCSVEGIQGVQRLRFGFVGRRAPRAKALRRWADGQRCLVMCGLGGLGKTALCTELAPLLARRLRPGGARILAFDGRFAGVQADPIFTLWLEIQAARSDADWARTLSELQKDGLTAEALAEAVARLAALEGGLLVYLDDAESLQVEVGDGEIGRWRTPELRRLWELLVGQAVEGGIVGLLASSRYVPEGTPLRASLPLPAMSRYETIRLFTWMPTLQRASVKDREWLADHVDGHPRTVEFLEALTRLQEEKVAPLGELYQGDRWREEILEPILGKAQEQVAANLLLGKVWETLSPEAREHLGRCSVLDLSVPWDAIRAVGGEAERTAELAKVGMLSPFQAPSGPEPWWAPHRLVNEEVRGRWDGDDRAANRLFGEWFQKRLDESEDFDFEMARRAVDHLIAAGEADLAWPTAQRIAIRLRYAGRYREALVWVDKVLEARATGARRGMALAFQAQLSGLAGMGRVSLQESLLEALDLVGREYQSFVLDELGALCASLGQLKEAADYLTRSVEVETEVKGSEHLDVAASLHALAGVLQDQGDLAGAREKLERSLAIQARVFETENRPSVAASLHALAGVLESQGDLAGAQERLERSLAIKERLFGTEDHPFVAASLHALAGVLESQGDLVGARENLERVLEIEAKVYGTREHYLTAITEMNLATSCDS
jgi:tetratricopeptide (TPR) repeat protein